MPQRPTSPNRLDINLAARCGAGLGLGACCLLEYRDSSLRTEDDIVTALSLPVLAFVPTMTTRVGARKRSAAAADCSLRRGPWFALLHRRAGVEVRFLSELDAGDVRSVLWAPRAALRSDAEPAIPAADGKHREALSNLQYGLTSRRGLTLLVGEAGTGKTTLIRAVIQEFAEAGRASSRT